MKNVKITSIGFSQRPVEQFINIVNDEAKKGCDLILLPEACTGEQIIESLDGDSLKLVSEVAARHGVYIVFPVNRKSGTEARLNSAVLI
jgi:predicted amidohydrolase